MGDDHNQMDDGLGFFKGLLGAVCISIAIYLLIYSLGAKAIAYLG